MRKLISVLILFVLLSQPCHATDITEALYPESKIIEAKDLLPEKIREAIDEYNIKDGQGFQNSLIKIKDYCVDTVYASAENLLRPITCILLVIILCSLLEPLFNGKAYPLYLFGGIEILCVTLSDSKAFFKAAIDAVQSLYDFSTVLLPCLAGTSVAAGASVSAGVKYTAAALFMNLLLNFSNTILIPMISVFVVSVIGATMFEQKILKVIADFIRWGCKTILTGATLLFMAYLNIAGLISSSGDLLSQRVAKTVIRGVLPVVGNILSDTASSLLAGAAILRNSIGIFGLLSVIGILIVPLLNLTLRYFLFTAISKLADFFPNRHFSGLIEGIAAAYGMMLGIVGTGFIMIFLTLVSFMQIVGG